MLPKLYLATSGIGGAVFFLIVRGRSWTAFVTRALVVFVASTVVLLQLLCYWILAVDPTRATGTIPLAGGLPVLVQTLVAFHIFTGALWQGWLIGAGLFPPGGRKQFRPPWIIACFSVAIYSLWILPWIFVVVFD
jgi:hypothetical protein